MNTIKKVAICAAAALSLTGAVTASAALQTPENSATESLEEISKPVEEASKPVEEASKPVEEASKPVEEASKLVEEASKPVEEASKPVEEAVKSAKESVYAEGLIPVFAKQSGVVAHYGMIFNRDYQNPACSPCVCLKLEDGSYAYYTNLLAYGQVRHMDEINVLYGEKVEKGQLIGYTYDEAGYDVTDIAPPPNLWISETGYIIPDILQSYVERGYTLPDNFQKILDDYNAFIKENPDKNQDDFMEMFLADLERDDVL